MRVFALLSLILAANAAPRFSELWSRNKTEAAGIKWRGNKSNSHDLLPELGAYPNTWNWCNMSGTNFCTMNRNQHLPQYCGACWAHGTLSALGDRIKIARGAKGIDINLAVQHILNCANVGSCYGGSVDGVYQWLDSVSPSGTGVAFETAQPYVACSSDVTYGLCTAGDFTCSGKNTARACGTFPENGGKCVGVKSFPNATIADYGSISGAGAMMKEIYYRGPIACGVDASQILNYASGIITSQGGSIDHVISIVGWDFDEATQSKYWIVRNSWGEYWGEMGYFRVQMGNDVLAIEEQCTWATVQAFTTLSTQSHCSEDGTQCGLSGTNTPSRN